MKFYRTTLLLLVTSRRYLGMGQVRNYSSYELSSQVELLSSFSMHLHFESKIESKLSPIEQDNYCNALIESS